MEFNLVHIQNLNIANCITADSYGWGGGGRPLLADICFKKSFFPCKKHIFHWAHLQYCDIGHKPYRPLPYRPRTKSATDHIGHGLYHIGHNGNQYRPQTI